MPHPTRSQVCPSTSPMPSRMTTRVLTSPMMRAVMVMSPLDPTEWLFPMVAHRLSPSLPTTIMATSLMSPTRVKPSTPKLHPMNPHMAHHPHHTNKLYHTIQLCQLHFSRI